MNAVTLALWRPAGMVAGGPEPSGVGTDRQELQGLQAVGCRMA